MDEKRERLFVRWNTADPKLRERIRLKFGMPDYTTVNMLSPAEIDPADMPLLTETARRGFISIVRRGWRLDGGVYAADKQRP